MKPDIDLQPEVVVPPSDGAFPSGVRGLAFGLLDADDLAKRALGIRHSLNDEEDKDYEESIFPQKFPAYSFGAWATDNTTINMNPGDVWFGSMSFVHWADILNASETPLVTWENTCVWLVVNLLIPETSYGDLGSGYVEMFVGPRSGGPSGTNMEDCLDETERRNMMVVPLVETTWENVADPGDPPDYVLTNVKELHPGDVLIPRAAG